MYFNRETKRYEEDTRLTGAQIAGIIAYVIALAAMVHFL